MKECPFGYSNSVIHCDGRCMMYENGCLIKEALKCYINEHTPVKTYDPYRKTEAELYEMLMNVKPSIPAFMREDCQSINDIPF